MSEDLTRPLLTSEAPGSPLSHCDSGLSYELPRAGSMGPLQRGLALPSAPAVTEHGCSLEQAIFWYKVLIPDDLSHQQVDELVKTMVDLLGFNVVNAPVFPEGMTLFLQLVLDCKMVPVESILELAIKKGGAISLKSRPEKGYPQKNVLQISIAVRSPELVQLVVKYVVKGACSAEELSEVFSESLCQLLEKQELSSYMRFGHMTMSFRTVFTEAVADRSFLISLGELYIPDTVFASSRDPFVVGFHDECCSRDDQSMWNFWQEVHPHMAAISDEEYDHSIKIRAHSFLVPYKDIAHPGKGGILEPILFMGCQDKVFKSLPVIALIKWKWENYAFRMGNLQMLICIGLLIVFTMYSMLFMKCTKQGSNQDFHPIMEILSIGSAALAWILFWGEIVQLSAYIQDGNTYRHKQYCFLSPSAGLHYWLYTKWNIVEVVSCFIVGVLLPALHFFAEFSSIAWHSWLVGGTGILLWWKMLYYLQLFERTSPLVIMIFDIAKDMMAFLSISIFLLVGFALGFIVLFHVENGIIHEEFSSLTRACLTLFAYLLGAFDLDEFVDTKYPNVAFGIFVVYEITMTIVLLNLLIAIMGDSFDRIKERESTTFLMSKAAMIEDMECINRRKLKKMNIPKYMHILVPSHNTQAGDGGDPWWAPQNEEAWQGRMVHLERKIRSLLRDSDQRMKKNVQSANDALNMKLDTLASVIDDSLSRGISPRSETSPNHGKWHCGGQLQQGLQESLDDAYRKIELKLSEIRDLVGTDLRDSRISLDASGAEQHPVNKRESQDGMHCLDPHLQQSIEQAVEKSAVKLRSRITGLEAAAGRRIEDMRAHISIQLSVMQKGLADLTSIVDTIAKTQASKRVVQG